MNGEFEDDQDIEESLETEARNETHVDDRISILKARIKRLEKAHDTLAAFSSRTQLDFEKRIKHLEGKVEAMDSTISNIVMRKFEKEPPTEKKDTDDARAKEIHILRNRVKEFREANRALEWKIKELVNFIEEKLKEGK